MNWIHDYFVLSNVVNPMGVCKLIGVLSNLQLLQLLLKASQDKKFVCEEAEKALKIMVDSIAPLPVLQKLRVYGTHANPRVRAKAAVSLSQCVSKMVLFF